MPFEAGTTQPTEGAESWELFIPDRRRNFVDLGEVREGDPYRFHRTMPGYHATPLYDAPALADRLRVGRVLVKDESERLGLPSFKMLGASWATARAIQREWFPQEIELTLEGLKNRVQEATGHGLAAATDGNHGRGVARMAKLLGLECSIFVPAGTAASRVAGIESEGAKVTIVDGTYDDAIARSTEEASDKVLVISDTSWDGYIHTPTDVIIGYSTMFREIDETLLSRGQQHIDLVLFQAGVGSFAASGIRHFARPGRSSRPTTVIVEPNQANCLLRSARAGELTAAPGPHLSSMAGLNCGLPSLLAWPLIEASADAYITIEDQWAHEAMALYMSAGLIAGESGAASLGALLATAEDDQARSLLGLREDSTVLLINTEGATDPVNFAVQVGKKPAQVAIDAELIRAASGTVAL